MAIPEPASLEALEAVAAVPEAPPEPVPAIEPEPSPEPPAAPPGPEKTTSDVVALDSDKPLLSPLERARAAMAAARERARQPREVKGKPPADRPIGLSQPREDAQICAPKPADRATLPLVAERATEVLQLLADITLVEPQDGEIETRRIVRKAAFALERVREHLERLRALAAADEGS